MRTLTVGEFKAQFSEVLKSVEEGERVAISYGKKKEIKAMLIPNDIKQTKRKLGILKGKATFKFIGGHNTTEEEFFGK